MGSGDTNEQPRAFKGDFKHIYNFQKVPFRPPFYQKNGSTVMCRIFVPILRWIRIGMHTIGISNGKKAMLSFEEKYANPRYVYLFKQQKIMYSTTPYYFLPQILIAQLSLLKIY